MPTTTTPKRKPGRPRSLTPTPLGKRLVAWAEQTFGSMAALCRRANLSQESVRGIVYGSRAPRLATLRALDRLGLPEHLLVDVVRGVGA